MDAFSRADFNRLIGGCLVVTLRLDDDGHLVGRDELEDVRVQFHTGFAAGAFLGVDDVALGHGRPPCRKKDDRGF